MGNTCSASTNNILAIAAMSKYMKLTKPQVMALRNIMLPYVRKLNGFIRRSHVEYATNVVGITEEPDKNIISLLFTMWDTSGSGKVNYNDFVVGFSVLACKHDSFDNALRFALQVMDIKRTGEVKSRDAFTVLKSICTTASYFGDTLLNPRQLYKLVDSIYDTITLISTDDDDITHDKFVTVLVNKPVIGSLVLTRRPAQLTSLTLTSPRDVSIPENEEFSCGPTTVSTPHSLGQMSYQTDATSRMSSLQLTPLTKLKIGS